MIWKMISSVLLALIFFAAPQAHAGKVELTTYYPSPAGEYDKIKSYGNCVGTTCEAADVEHNKLNVKGDVVIKPGVVGGTSNLVVSSPGKVGVGTVTMADVPAGGLAVQSSVKIGEDRTDCTGTNAGAMRYNSGTKAMEYCDGTNWRGVFTSVGWVSLNAPAPHTPTFDISNWARWGNTADHSPTKICQAAGYSVATGGCKTTTNYAFDTRYAEGSNWYYHQPVNNEGMYTCAYAGAAGVNATPATQIACAK